MNKYSVRTRHNQFQVVTDDSPRLEGNKLIFEDESSTNLMIDDVEIFFALNSNISIELPKKPRSKYLVNLLTGERFIFADEVEYVDDQVIFYIEDEIVFITKDYISVEKYTQGELN